jgi:hypothetical protein
MVGDPLEGAGVTVQFPCFLFGVRLDTVNTEPSGFVKELVIEPEHQ